MLIVGLTGNIGSGKSIVAAIFSSLGIPVYNADNNAKKFLDNIEVKSLIKSAFGDKVFEVNYSINKKSLADIVFNDSDKLKTLNSIIHPFVIEDFKSWIQLNLTTNNHKLSTKYVIIEAAILFETGYNTIADKIIVVTCPEDLRIKRIMKRDSMTEPEVRQRMKNQWNEDDIIKLAGFIIKNDEMQLITPQALEIHKQIMILNLNTSQRF